MALKVARPSSAALSYICVATKGRENGRKLYKSMIYTIINLVFNLTAFRDI